MLAALWRLVGWTEEMPTTTVPAALDRGLLHNEWVLLCFGFEMQQRSHTAFANS